MTRRIAVRKGMRRSGLSCGILLTIALIQFEGSSLRAQSGVGVSDRVPQLVNSVVIMPYVTGSYNSFSGKAFPEPAKGMGFGGGLTFDLTDTGKSGFMFDFAFQDMRGAAQNGSCVIPGLGGVPVGDTNIQSADAYHYWQYVLFEPFYKFQGAKKNGYLLLGLSLGYAVLSETVSTPVSGPSQYTLWSGSPNGNPFRLDIRAGIGIKLADIGKHQLIFEARAGYPVFGVINSNYVSACSGGDVGGWRIITFQGNLGLRI